MSQLLSANKRNEPKGRCSCEADGSFGIIMSGGCNELPTLGKHLLDIEEIRFKTGLKAEQLFLSNDFNNNYRYIIFYDIFIDKCS